MDYIRVTVATLKGSRQPERARKFAEYITSEKNQEVWRAFGFDPADRSRPHPMLAGQDRPTGSIFVHCAAGMRLPIRVMADEFENKYGVSIDLNYDGSNRLLGQIKLTRKGDVYISGDTDYIEMAAKAGLVRSSRTVCYFVPVIITAKGNPKGLRGLADLTRPGIRIGQGDEKAAAVGRITPLVLELNGIDRDAWSRNVVMETPTVNELGIGIKLGTIDAALVWDAIAAKYSDFSETVAIDPERNVCPEVGVAVLETAKNPELGRAFLEFMTSTQGRNILKQHGYTVDPPGKERSSL